MFFGDQEFLSKIMTDIQVITRDRVNIYNQLEIVNFPLSWLVADLGKVFLPV